MIKRILALIVLFGFAGFVVVTSWPGFVLPSLEFVFESASHSRDPDIGRLNPAVVQVNVVFQEHDGFGSALSVSRRNGTGFNIDPRGVIITNHHVVAGATGITVSFPDYPAYAAESWRSVADLDLAVIELGRDDLPALKPALGVRPPVGEPVTVIGNPLGMQNIVARGMVGSYLRLDGYPVPVMELSTEIHEGNSGSPVINVAEEVVGVVFGSIRYETDDGVEIRGLALPLSEAGSFLRDADNSSPK